MTKRELFSELEKLTYESKILAESTNDEELEKLNMILATICPFFIDKDDLELVEQMFMKRFNEFLVDVEEARNNAMLYLSQMHGNN